MEIEADQVKLYVPENPVYRKVEISGLFCLDSDGNLKYDYAAYDALLQEWSQNFDPLPDGGVSSGISDAA